MKRFFKQFCMRGLIFAWGGPVVLALIYLCLGLSNVVQTLDVFQVVLGIVSSALMAFIAAGVTTIYQVERLPLMYAILIHGGVLYLDYLGIYLLNGWIADGIVPFLVFTAVFVVGFAITWLIISIIIKHNAKKFNQKLNNQQ